MSRELDDLSPEMRPLAVELLARTVEAKIPVTIIYTRRTEAEQALLLEQGISWTKSSRHLTGDAIDICPTRLLDKKWWAPGDPDWLRLGEIGESIGLQWGGRWTMHPDQPHFQMKV